MVINKLNMQLHDADPYTSKCEEMVAMCVCLNLRKSTRVVTQVFDRALAPAGLRSTQLPVLVTLSVIGNSSVTHLANELVMDRTSLARLLNPLKDKGLIDVAPGVDGRTKEIRLTALGREKVEEAIPLWDKAQAQILAQVGNDGLRNLQTILAAVHPVA